MVAANYPKPIQNLDKSDNRWVNLRAATRSQNKANTSLRKNNASVFKGVCWHKHARKWTAQIRGNGTNHYLGVFKTAEEAHAAYCKAAAELFGEFARAS